MWAGAGKGLAVFQQQEFVRVARGRGSGELREHAEPLIAEPDCL